MAVAAYYSWDRLGRPLEPARPIRELVDALKAGYPAAADQALFSWYADEAHYQASFPEDHTPYSYTGWPQPNPFWWVCATDIMHRPDLGVDCHAIVAHLLESAKAGLTPWLKYVIWEGLLYHVSNGWRPVANSGHFDHAHISARTDHLQTGLGDWSPIPGGDMSARSDEILAAINGGLSSLADGTVVCTTVWRQRDEVWQAEVTAALKADAVRDAATHAAIAALANAGGVDAAPIVAAINAVRDEARQEFTSLEGALAVLQAENASLRARLAEAAQAEADALKAP